ncbi:MAG TPA: glycosyltransferase [Rhizobiales bacterium]|nr:glycosyltransferase [Hyphomicrobiales bacterium]
MTDRPIRSVHIIGSRASGGAERFYIRIVRSLHALGHPVLAVCPPGSAIAQKLVDVPMRPLSMRSIWDLYARWNIAHATRSFGTQIVQTYLGRATRLTHLKGGGRSVHVARLGGYYNLDHYRHAHAWVANTGGIYRYLITNGFPAKRVFHIGNFVEPAPPRPATTRTQIREAAGIPPDAYVLVSVGRLHPNKAFDNLLTAFAALPRRVDYRPLHLVIVGDGPLRGEIQDQARSLRIAADVHFVGWQSDPNPYYQMADIFICPSRIEPLGNVILEAWSHGLPVIATRSAGAEELIHDGVDGRLVPIDDPATLAAAIRGFLETDTKTLEAFAEAGRVTLAENHGAESVLARYIEMYRLLSKDN